MLTCAIEMPSGIAGDMLLAALIDCGADAQRIESDLLTLGLGPLPLEVEKCHVSSLKATCLSVKANRKPNGGSLNLARMAIITAIIASPLSAYS